MARPDKFRHDAQNADNARKNTAFPPVCKKCAKVCRAPENGKSHEESYDSSWDFGALEGTRIPGPLIKSQMLYRLSYERIHYKAQYNTILPNNITTTCAKMQGFPGKKAQKAPASVWASAFHPRSRSKMLRCRQRKGLHPDNFLFTNPARIVTIKSNPSAVRCVLLPGSVRPAALHPQTFSRLWHSAGPRRYVFCRRFFL